MSDWWPWMRWLHLVAAATWLGGMVALGTVVMALRREGVERTLLQAAARAFGRVSWVAMGIALATGIAQVELLHLSWGNARLKQKLAVVAVTVVVAIVHVRIARRLEGGGRGAMEAALLILSLAVFAAAVRL